MSAFNLGNLEETILLIVMAIEDAYGFAVTEEYKNVTDKSISISAVHSVLSRLEKKGFIKSSMGGATDERGGRRKRIFTPTSNGTKAIELLKQNRVKLWNLIPQLNSK